MCKYFHCQASYYCSVSVYATEVLVLLRIWAAQGVTRSVCSLPWRTEKVGSWRNVHFCHTRRHCSWRHRQTARHKMAALTVVFPRHPNVDFNRASTINLLKNRTESIFIPFLSIGLILRPLVFSLMKFFACVQLAENNFSTKRQGIWHRTVRLVTIL